MNSAKGALVLPRLIQIVEQSSPDSVQDLTTQERYAGIKKGLNKYDDVAQTRQRQLVMEGKRQKLCTRNASDPTVIQQFMPEKTNGVESA